MSRFAVYPLRADIMKPDEELANTDGNPMEKYEMFLEDVPVYFQDPPRGKEFKEAGGIHSETVGKIRLRFIDGIKPDMLLVLNNRTFAIIPPINNVHERNRELVLTVKEVI